MAKTEVQSVDEYIAAQPEDAQKALKRVRSIIRKAVPKAAEVISYKIPAYKLHGSAVLYFAGWKKHYSLYPATDALVTALKKDLASYELSKGTIRFPLSEPVPKDLIESIAKFRAAEVIGMPTAKPRTTKKPAAKTRAKPAVKKPMKTAAKPAAKKPAKPKPKKR
jgi:uncharacterized protein YdhG (YjbR/CyaY superfamily)